MKSSYAELSTTTSANDQRNALNPYELMLNTKSGQLVELANLASYLGSSVHIQACSELLTQLDTTQRVIGDGFARNSRRQVRQYCTTVPEICQLYGRSVFNNLPQSRCKAVELTQLWPFGLANHKKFINTRADMLFLSSDTGYKVVELKTKWSPNEQAQSYTSRPLPRDVKQVCI